VGYLDLERATVHSLYVAPRAQRTGVGTALVELAKARRPGGFDLWVFVTNTPARGLYRARGLVELETTDGSDNEEHAPDVRMAWPGRDPVAYLRSRIDAVDAEIATLVGRRVALTSAVQRHKERPGHDGRDPDREQQIARRMARRTPDLEVADLARVVRTLVEVGLDVAERRGRPPA
jgi:chorismate mutase